MQHTNLEISGQLVSYVHIKDFIIPSWSCNSVEAEASPDSLMIIQSYSMPLSDYLNILCGTQSGIMAVDMTFNEPHNNQTTSPSGSYYYTVREARGEWLLSQREGYTELHYWSPGDGGSDTVVRVI